MYYSNSDIRIEEMPVPELRSGEVLMKVEASGICGSDVLEWYRLKKAPLVLGHEVAGEVVKVADGVSVFKPGDRIVAAHHVPCNACYHCLTGHHTACEMLRCTNFDPGGNSEFIRLPSINVQNGVHLIPEGITFEEATFHEPLGCVIRGQRIARLMPGQCVAVFGAGIAGLLHVRLARFSGAGKILAADLSPFRMKAAERFGANRVVSPSEDMKAEIKRINRGRLADLVIDCTGKMDAIHKALKCVERGGTVLLFAPTSPDIRISISVNDLFFRNDITLTTSYGASPYDSRLALEIIQNAQMNIKEMISHRLPLSETAAGFQLVVKAQDSLKVIIEPQK